MKIGELWLSREKEIGGRIESIEDGKVTVRICDSGQACQTVPSGGFLDKWERSPDFAATGFSWMRESDRDAAASATVLRVSAGRRTYVVYVSDEAMQDLKLATCRQIAEKKIVAAPWLRKVLVRSTDT